MATRFCEAFSNARLRLSNLEVAVRSLWVNSSVASETSDSLLIADTFSLKSRRPRPRFSMLAGSIFASANILSKAAVADGPAGWATTVFPL